MRSRASAALTADVVVASAFQELDVAHEELKQAEAYLHAQAEELASTVEALERERSESHDLFEHAPEPYLLTDMAGRILLSNRRAAELFNLECTFLRDKPLINFIERGDRSRFLELIAKLPPNGSTLRAELQLRPRGGKPSVRCITSLSRIANNAAGAEAALRWMFCDWPMQWSDTGVFERGALDAARSEPERAASRENTRFVAQLTQELRTNLSSTSGWLQVARQHLTEDAAGQRAFTSITRSVRGMIGLVDRLATYARLEQSEVPLRRVRVPLLEFTGRLVEELRTTALHRGIRLSALLESGAPVIVADPVQLHRALTSLMQHAARSTAPGGELYVALSRLGKGAVLRIQSTGCGIDNDVLQQSSGTGAQGDLDLWRARRCLELHGAMLETESAGQTPQARITISFPGAGALSVAAQPSDGLGQEQVSSKL
ncbi:MAG TPA: PAS domain-containing sensor histidine kinase [Polyangiales bacterium]|nr:PAS domain-containing sensor histidine kinase [Polyangiales bacterium]